MNQLAFAKQVEVISLLTEGSSLRATERLTGVSRNTIMRLGRLVGEACNRLHHARMRNLQVSRLELDETWSFVQKKQARVEDHHPAEQGDCYLWLALDSARKAIISYRIGKRHIEDAKAFVADLRARVENRPQISTDGYIAYVDAIEEAFGTEVDYAMLKKQVSNVDGGTCFGLTKEVRQGNPDLEKVSTSYIERANLTVRMHLRRCARRTNAFSKKLEPHRAAIALHIAFYNWCRVHETLRVTPAIELGLTDHVWSIGELLREAQTAPLIAPISPPRPSRWADRKPFKLRVIRGGKIG